VQVYRLPFAHTLRQEGEGRWGLRLTFPVTVGLIDFRPTDLPQTGLPDNVDTVSLVPGAELRFLARERWLIKPFLEAGPAKDRGGDADAFVFAGGLRSVAGFRSGGFHVDLGNGLVYVRVDPRETGRSDDSVIFETSVQARRPLGFEIARREVDVGLYGIVDLYFDDAAFPFRPQGSSNTAQYEIGLTLGTVDPVRWWKIKLPRLGAGYRFGSGVSSARLVIGLPARSLKR
jgi:hypothetical protein